MKENSWRDFQSGYILVEKKQSFFLKTKKSIIWVMAVLVFIGAIYLLKINVPEKKDIYQENVKEQVQLSKNQLNHIIANTEFNNTGKNIFFVDTAQARYKITTSIDIYLQQYLLSLMDNLKTLNRGKPQRIALVVMQADTGKIIAMTGFDLDNPDTNPCMESDYPAASIFKIVTAAAAVETLGYTPKTQLYFNGNKYTLYKRQLKDVKNKYTSKISFSKAFAESINPVFGKIGKNYLGKEKLDHYADAFGFNKVFLLNYPFRPAHSKPTAVNIIWLSQGAVLTLTPPFHRYLEPCLSRQLSTPAISYCPVLLNM